MTNTHNTPTGSITRNNSKSPFLAFIRDNGERLQISYASIHHIMFPLPTTEGESCCIYAAGYEIMLQGKHLQKLGDYLLDCHVSKITQIREENAADNESITVTKMAWDIAFSRDYE